MTDKLSYEELDAILTEITFSEPSIASYTFILHLLCRDEKARLHEIAFELLVHPLCHIQGAYFSALHHARRCIVLADQEELADYLSYLLFLHEVPDKVISKQEAFATANRILELDPYNEAAKSYFTNK
ncbi:hypothetical protein SAMN05421663_1075 [Terribacillus halophilus]|uniref:Immunity protein 30 n=2 Tax=Terribacillus halophilus TaxID=361279 RepID=A0A1G6S791_9BACI|nr:hypothetical protein SAMN05421663_1075 [Terribacillus halophilus]